MAAGPVSKNIQKLFFYEEPSRAAFAVDHSGTLADFLLVPHIEGSIAYDPGVTTVDPGQGVHHVFDWREKILSHKAWTLSFQVALTPSATLAGDGVAAVPSPAARLLKNVLGGIAIGEGTTVATTWANGISGALSDVTTLAPGMALGFVIAGRLYVREIESIVTGTVTLKVALPAAPQEDDVVYGAVTIFLHRNPAAFAQFLVIGEEAHDRYVFKGGIGSVTLELNLGGDGVPMLSFEFEGRAWDYGEDAATDLSALPFLPEPYAQYAPIPAHVGEFIEQEVGVATLSTTAVKELSFALSMDKRPITNPAAPEGLSYWMRVRANGPAVTGSFTPSFYEDTSRQRRRDARDDMYLAYAFGTSTSSGAVLLTASRVQYLSSPPVESDGVSAETVEWEGRTDADTVEATPTDRGLSPFRVHFVGGAPA